MKRTAFFLVLLLGYFTLSATAQNEISLDQRYINSSARPIINNINTLESKSDPKCQSTATRLENFMFGTTLDEAARLAKIELQKTLVFDIWQKASIMAEKKNKEFIDETIVQSVLDKFFKYKFDKAGNVKARINRKKEFLLETDIRQYSSIAYGYRAILSVQQDLLLISQTGFINLDSDAINKVKKFLDVATLIVLKQSDQSARQNNEFSVTEENFRSHWGEIFGGLVASKGNKEDLKPQDNNLAYRIIFDTIEQKINSYEMYNKLAGAATMDLFRINMWRFFLRLSAQNYSTSNISGMEEKLNEILYAYAHDIIDKSQDLARASNEPIIRADVMNKIIQSITPFTINDFEDITFFPNLEYDSQVVIEAYDADSFRDVSIHWQILRSVLEDFKAKGGLAIDPFSAEIIAEAISQYAVLALRLAGERVHQREENNDFESRDLVESVEKIKELSRLNKTVIKEIKEGKDVVSAAKAQSGPNKAFFTDVTDELNISFTHGTSDWLSRYRRDVVELLTTYAGGGVASDDLNNDGWMDVLLVGGRGNLLLVSDKKGGFVDMTKQAHINYKREDGTFAEARNPIIADLNNDGLKDIFITYDNDDQRVYKNLGNLAFEDMTLTAKIAGKGLTARPAVAFDYDNDGLLDLFIGYFGNYLGTPGYGDKMPMLNRSNRNGIPSRLYRNLGNFHFEDVTKETNTADTGWNMAASHSDINGDGYQDIIIANDFGQNTILLNGKEGVFRNASDELGFRTYYHSMNVGIADLNKDGYPDFYISNINPMIKDDKYVFPNEETPFHFKGKTLATMRVKETSELFSSNVADGKLSQYTVSEKVERQATSAGWAWDADFFDFDNDGDDDLYVLNGMNPYRFYDDTTPLWVFGENPTGKVYSYSKESNVFYVNEDGMLKNESAQSGADFAGTSRSAAYLDMDNDGDLDIIINGFHDKARVFRNNADAQINQWLKVRLVGDFTKGSNRDAIGARLILTDESGNTVWREIHGGIGFMSDHPKEQHFGLGKSQKADLNVVWPNGEKKEYKGFVAGNVYEINQKENTVLINQANFVKVEKEKTIQ